MRTMHRRVEFRLYAIGSIVAMMLASSEAGVCQRLSPKAEQETFADVFLSGRPYPKWSGPFLLVWYDVLAADPGENLVIYRKDGRVAAKMRLWFPDASEVSIHDVAASRGGMLAAVGGAYENTGPVAGFLALISSTGQITDVIHTAPLLPAGVVFGADDSLWIVGGQIGPGGRWSTAPEHFMLQHYTAGGKLVALALPSSAWRCTMPPAGPGVQLLTSRDRIVVLSETCWEWAELTAKGEFIALRPLPDMLSSGAKPDRLMWSAAMTPDGRIVVDLGAPGLYSLSPHSDVWQRVEVGADRADMLGGDGESLVFHGGNGQVFHATVRE
jgi:hypothetical protein